MANSDAVQHTKTYHHPVDQFISEFASPRQITWRQRVHHFLGRLSAQLESIASGKPEIPSTEPNFLHIREHDFVDATFSGRGFVPASKHVLTDYREASSRWL